MASSRSDVTKPPYIFLQEDYDALVGYMQKIKQDIAGIQSEVGFSTSQSSETWHDNIMHEELMRKYAMEEANYDRYRSIQKLSQIVPANTDLKCAGLGNTVTIVDSDGNEQEYTIGSYLSIEPKKGAVSYVSPLGKLIYGSSVGKIVKGEIAQRPIAYTIKVIS